MFYCWSFEFDLELVKVKLTTQKLVTCERKRSKKDFESFLSQKYLASPRSDLRIKCDLKSKVLQTSKELTPLLCGKSFLIFNYILIFFYMFLLLC